MLDIKKEYVVDARNKKKAVLVDLRTFERIEGILEDYGLAQYMKEIEDEEILDASEAKEIYRSMKKEVG
jgi:hypothetical protein